MLDNVYALYPYGSRVYGTDQPDSDYDYILVSEDAGNGKMIQGDKNYKCMSPEHFQRLLDEHNISALECLFLPKELVIVEPKSPWSFKLDKVKLRKSISAKANHSWVKAKKKLIAPYEWATDETRRGQKSLFHSFRILNYGIQIAEHGKIVDYAAANDVFEDIMTDSDISWDNYEAIWKKRHNALFTKFRKAAPKK